jgi:hypothetical protein
MPPPKEILWKYFLAGEKQNSFHIHAHYCDCIEKKYTLGGSIELDNVGNPKLSKWLLRSLELLFAGRKESDIDEQPLRQTRRLRQQGYTEEAWLMELLVDEEADEERIPDDGELEGSGDDFDG